MKKLILFALVALITLSYIGDNMAAGGGSKAIAIALKVKGKVELTRDGKTSTLKFGTPLNHGDMVETKKGGFVSIMFTDDKSLIKLTEFTEVIIEGKRSIDGTVAKRISMEIGELFAKVEKQKGTLEVATPTSVASVKGTQFWVVVLADGTTTALTLEGLVELMNRMNGQIVEVRQAQQGEVDNEGNMVVEDVPEGDLNGRGDPDPQDEGRDQAPLKTMQIDLRNGDDTRTIEIQYREGDDENDE